MRGRRVGWKGWRGRALLFAGLLLTGVFAAGCHIEGSGRSESPDRGTRGTAPESRIALHVHVLDVGQGDAVLLQLPDGRSVLYDGGPSGRRVLQELDALGVDSLELVVASHPHQDHIGGLVDVLREIPVRFVMESGMTHTTLTYERFLEALAGSGALLLEPEGQRISFGPATLLVLEPPGEPRWGLNDNSVGIVVEHGSFTLVLAGDAERAQWEWWVDRGVLPRGPISVHKASHHGSRNGDTAAGIERLRPRAVVIGVGRDNPYGHPHEEALGLYRGVEAEIFRTDRDGRITVEVREGGAFTIRTKRR